MKSKKSLWIALAVVAVVVIAAVGWIMSTYNGLVETREQVTAQQANVQSQLQRRADLIPNLVSTVQAYATHEEEVYTALADARAALAGASTVGAQCGKQRPGFRALAAARGGRKLPGTAGKPEFHQFAG
mgnify:CR=1 FL=1